MCVSGVPEHPHVPGCSYGANSLSFHSNHTSPTTHIALTHPLIDMEGALGSEKGACELQGFIWVLASACGPQNAHMVLTTSVSNQKRSHRPHTRLMHTQAIDVEVLVGSETIVWKPQGPRGSPDPPWGNKNAHMELTTSFPSQNRSLRPPPRLTPPH